MSSPPGTRSLPDGPAAQLAPMVATIATAVAAVALGIALVVVTAAFGVPALGVAAITAVIGVAVVLARPALAALLLVVVEVTNVSEVVGHRAGVSVYVLALGLASAALVVGLFRGKIRLVWSPVFLMAAIFLAGRALSLFAATDLKVGMAVVGGTARDLLFFIVLTTLLVSAGSETRMFRLAVAVMALLAGLTLVQEFVLHNATSFGGLSKVPLPKDLGGTTVRHSGPQSDVNFWGRSLALFVPMALSLWAAAGLCRRRWAWMAAAVALGAGEYLTQSRGGLLSVGLAVVAWLALAGRRHARLLMLVPGLIVVLLLVPGVGSRLGTLGAIEQAEREGGDPSLVGRLAVQRAGVGMILDHPVLGVGPGNFEVVEREYQRRLGLVSSRILKPHNLYLEMTAESGMVGLLSWLLLYGSALFAAARTMIVGRRLSPGTFPTSVWLAVGIAAGLVGWAAASIFLHLTYFRLLLVVVAFVTALDASCCRSARIRSQHPVPATDGQPHPPSPSPGGTGQEIASLLN